MRIAAAVLYVVIAAGVVDFASPAAAQGTWSATSLTDRPLGRGHHTAVWTGSRMIVWGGTGPQYSDTDTGGAYDPVAGVWTPLSTTNAPAARDEHTAVWTGSRMLVWGGWSGNTPLSTGGSYDPVTDTWTSISTSGAPSPRVWHTAVWTGSRMIVWGGMNLGAQTYFNTGGVYDPATDSWTPTSTAGAPTPRRFHTAVWTGSRMLVWGGFDSASGLTSTGASYDPATDAWSPLSSLGAPDGRIDHTAVWTGTRMVVWGGMASTSTVFGTGGIYNPGTDTWQATSTAGPPLSRRDHTAVWTGSRMVVWGGTDDMMSVPYDSGGIYDVRTDSWAGMEFGAPSARASHTAVWTGSAMVVWGGVDTALLFTYDTGGVYQNAVLSSGTNGFFTLTPCRVADTRNATGPAGGPALAANTQRSFQVAGVCGVPATASAVALNVTAVDETDGGDLRLYPAAAPMPLASALNFAAGKVRANNAVVPLGSCGQLAVRNDMPPGSQGSTQVLFDATGYFETTSEPLPTCPGVLAPAEGAVFDNYPRTLFIEWTAVPGATSYTIELQLGYLGSPGQWTPLSQSSGYYGSCAGALTVTSCSTPNFPGANPGRLRVTAATTGLPQRSAWRYFRFAR